MGEKYKAVIGLEVHAQLQTKTKIYNSDSTDFGDLPNTNVGFITLGHPGTLPKLNKKVIEYAIKMGLACNSEIAKEMIFDRKNYFYPDLPKGYQITQDRTPICVGGQVLVSPKNARDREVRLNRIHIEEDAGKSIHLTTEEDTLVDFNRAGVPLIEIVTEPDIHTSAEAHAFLTEVRRLVRYLDICDGDMEKGSLRCDANISVMLKDSTTLGKKVEVKNMNSMRNVQRAIDHEIERQIQQIESGSGVVSETRTFDANTGSTSGMRTKEELNDYRYFPDPDLSPVIVSEKWLQEIASTMPTLPRQLCEKFVSEFKIPIYDAEVLTESKEIAKYFEDICNHTKNYKAASNWLMGPIKSYLNDNNIEISQFPLSPEHVAELISMVDSNQLSFSVASNRVLPALIKTNGESAQSVATRLNLLQENNTTAIEEVIDKVLNNHPEKVKAYKTGKKALLGMFMGEVMKESKGKADPKLAKKILLDKLN